MAEWEKLFINANLATMTSNHGNAYGQIEHGALGVSDGIIQYSGLMKTLARAPKDMAEQVIDLGGRLVTPGLIDCHTHLVFAGDRSNEFELRQNGMSYSDIAKAGGGINATVMATRQASFDELFEAAQTRLLSLMMEGVTTVEIKSGYGLDIETERKMLKVARELGQLHPIEVKTTFLGAHSTPTEYHGDNTAYINHIIDEMLPTLAAEGLVDAVDAFMEGIAFNQTQVRALFEKAKELNIPIKLHADQLTNTSGGALAAEFNALSADHLEYSNADTINEMAKAGTVAVLLPGAFYSLKEVQKPDIAAMRKANLDMAIATDMNPGTSPTQSLLLMMNMAATLFGLTTDEALSAVTRNAAKALGINDNCGTLTVGKQANIAVWNVASPATLSNWFGANPLAFSCYLGELQMLADPEFEAHF
jgi:imidazolonepropionase